MSAWEKAVGKVQGHDSWFKMSSSIIFLSCLYPKRIIWKCSCQPYYSKVKCIWVKDFLTKKSCKKSIIYNTVYERRHSKLFRSCHVSWDTLYLTLTYFQSLVLTCYTSLKTYVKRNWLNNFCKENCTTFQRHKLKWLLQIFCFS